MQQCGKHVILPNEMLLGTAPAWPRPHARRRPLAAVPDGEWLCGVDPPPPPWKRRTSTASAQVGTSLWAKDKRGLWGEAIVQTAEEAGGGVVRVGLRWKGFAAKYDEVVDVGGGRPPARGPPAREREAQAAGSLLLRREGAARPPPRRPPSI